MGQEKKGEMYKDDEKEVAPVIVLKVDMHCQDCARKVAGALKLFQGVEEFTVDNKKGRVVVKSKSVDPVKLCQWVHKKSGRKAEIISPEENKTKMQQHQPVETIVLKTGMHCEACAQALHKRITKIKGVESVTANVIKDEITVKGMVLDHEKLLNEVYKRTGKHATIVKDEKTKDTTDASEKKNGKKSDDVKKTEEHWSPSPKYYMEHDAPQTQIFSDDNPNACSLM